SILLSKFTTNYTSLLYAVNLGGLGTPIASLASLITLKEFGAHYPAKKGNYLLWFSVVNFAFLAILYVLCAFVI
ncbi:MAG: citrate transporter, partial [Clostridia bacterium]